jgi:arylsulfatase A-like enzyme
VFGVSSAAENAAVDLAPVEARVLVEALAGRRGVSSLPHVPHLGKLENGLEGYDASNATLDRHFGEVLKALDQAGVADYTVVFYLSDHGGEVDDSKFTLYEPGVRIPLLVKAPECGQGPADSDALISIIDILPTMIEIAGGKPSPDMDGRSLRPLLSGTTSTHHEQVFMSFTAAGVKGVSVPFPIRAIRMPEYKLVHYFIQEYAHPVSSGKYASATVGDVRYFEEYELFDRDGGFEGENLSGSPELAAVEANLNAALDDWMVSMGDHGVETELAVFEVIKEQEHAED